MSSISQLLDEFEDEYLGCMKTSKHSVPKILSNNNCGILGLNDISKIISHWKRKHKLSIDTLSNLWITQLGQIILKYSTVFLQFNKNLCGNNIQLLAHNKLCILPSNENKTDTTVALIDWKIDLYKLFDKKMKFNFEITIECNESIEEFEIGFVFVNNKTNKPYLEDFNNIIPWMLPNLQCQNGELSIVFDEENEEIELNEFIDDYKEFTSKIDEKVLKLGLEIEPNQIGNISLGFKLYINGIFKGTMFYLQGFNDKNLCLCPAFQFSTEKKVKQIFTIK